MNRFFILFLVPFSWLIPVRAQFAVYHPFPDSNAVWNVGVDQSCTFFSYTDEQFSYVLAGDTMIHGHYYHQLHIPFVNLRTNSCGQFHFPGYAGAVRQDTAARTVYFIPPFDSLEQLLFEFNLQAGDTMHGILYTNCKTVVVAIDSVLAGNEYRRRWRLSDFNTVLIEGIGTNHALLEQPCDWIDAFSSTLDCFTENGTTRYNSTGSPCNIIQHIASSADVPAVSIFPNPAQDELTIRLKRPGRNNARVVLYNMTGSMIWEKNFPGSECRLSLQQLESGVYILKIVDGEDILFQRVEVAR